ncbi:hypothetical protein CJF42_06465 [Pseudoalteromonas sp. NBT06-2]|uniref:motility associated factor glycosyltransferase family protein n=1 Tax=Pseudoalteromonas sp. NBT06-2 TaxID=2025950 RepID=UPI000BA61A57|nr:6-hydroxymethylpterin diphosphokinase MptE-like protein [Pseudoalteromonas sp. NBT06-2]PAJ75130.1 hypothetical protein CJF42_06465 [Pseudoalteromonas sp. NBT06-2]
MSEKRTAEESKEQLKTVLSYTLYQNLLALKEYFPAFYNRFLEYKPKTHGLELTPDGILNAAYPGGFIYDGDPQKICNEQFNNFFSCTVNSVYTINSEEAELPNQVFKHPKLVAAVAANGDEYIAKAFSKKYESPSCFPVLSIIGVGLGYHLEQLVNKNIQHLFIYEPNNDLFYASLHTVDYRKIFEHFTQKNKGITLEIGSQPEFFIESIHKQLFERGLFRAGSFPVYRHYESGVTNEALTRFFDNVSNFYNGFGFFEDEIISSIHTMKNIRDNRKFLPADVLLDTDITDKPVFICANGPSLDSNIDFLKANRDKYYLFSGGSALMPLYKAGLTPDFHFEIERTEGLFKYVSVINDDEYYKKITLITMNTVSPIVMDLFGDVYTYFKPNDGGTELMRTALGQNEFNKYLHLFDSNPTVSNAALAFAIKLGFSKIFLHGVDLGYIDSDYHHSKESIYFKEDDSLPDFSNSYNKDKTVPGNFEDTVFSNMIFDWSRHTMEHSLRKPENAHLNCFNCSNGAKIDRAIPLKVEDCRFSSNKLPDIKKALANLNCSSIIEFKVLCEKVTEFSQELFKLMDKIVDPKLGDVTVTQHQLMEHFNFQYYSTVKVGKEENVFICRMLIGSLNYLQTVIVGKMHFIRNQTIRDEYATSSLKYLCDYMNVMKQEYSNLVLDWINSQK